MHTAQHDYRNSTFQVPHRLVCASSSCAVSTAGLCRPLPLAPVHQMYVGLAISVIITLLRIITTQPITDK
jgi:hypothetical protein